MTAIVSFFSVTPREYEKISFSPTDASTATVLIWGICLVSVLASLYAFYVQKVPGRVARTLLRCEAEDADSAKTAEELGIGSSSLAMLELTRGTALRRIVHTTDASTPRYFIPAELRYRAEVRYDKKGNGFLGLLFAVLLSIGLALLLINLLPMVLGIIDGAIK